MKLYKGYEAEYKKRHSALWPELKQLLQQTGISSYSIFLDEQNGDLFGVFNVNASNTLEDLPGHPVMKKWWAFMCDIMETNTDLSPASVPLREVFYLE